MSPAYLDLADEQQDLLRNLPFDGCHLVTGPPGSGKSVLAAQHASLVALTGVRVHLLTRSNLLRQTLTVHGDVEVSTVHAWIHAWHRARTGEPAPRADADWFDWPELFALAAVEEDGEGFALVVDEGQDLPPSFYRLCRLLGVPVTVFADECQRITDTQSTLDEISSALGECARHQLTLQHRSTRPVAALAAHFHTGDTAPPLPSRTGPVPQLRRYADQRALIAQLVAHAERRPQHTIGVIVRTTRQQLALHEHLERTAPRLRSQVYVGAAAEGRHRTLDLRRPGVRVISRASAKGLEFDSVFVPDVHTDGGDPGAAALRMTYYVLLTRARQEIHLGYEGVREPPPVAGVPEDLLLRSV
ncbi:AAA domain-containing protein [Streptomyces sp. BK208]|uniref:AAA family ATPase n=1 Tax=Streptomyces sp. BK208 TaxID=2512150 RepID=UPI00105DF143|nr:AAA family ATPase [Streptomyces sp. BK208]TDT40031.1 AAA domain-containing protein [Streptomyces sp. BK208]